MKKTISIISIVIVAIMVLALPLSAATPYHTYTYSIDGKDLRSPDAYVPDQEITSAYMGLTDRSRMKALYPDLTEDELKKKMVGIKTPTDLEVDENNNVYIADKDNSRIVVLDPYYKLKFIIDSFKKLINHDGYKWENIEYLNAYVYVIIQYARTLYAAKKYQKEVQELQFNLNKINSHIVVKSDSPQLVSLKIYANMLSCCLDLKYKILKIDKKCNGEKFLTSDNPVCIFNPLWLFSY